ncbi:MAG: hypothetical protein QOC81_516 [Thermoanaerobaculia bacterium]|jgi:hypothetical protein|nr:hypothetical protein [Thermoanaerobaculia bacterium]
MRLVKQDDGILDVLTKAVSVAGIILGGWVYFHSIYPVFTKEQQLREAKREAEALKRERVNQQMAIAANAQTMRTQAQEIEAQRGELHTLQETGAATRAEADRIRVQLAAEQSRAQQIESAAIESHLVRYRDAIVREGVDREVRRVFDAHVPLFDAREYTLNYVEQQRHKIGDVNTTAAKTEAEALSLLDQFAKTKLAPHSSYGDMYNVTIFFLDLQRRHSGL